MMRSKEQITFSCTILMAVQLSTYTLLYYHYDLPGTAGLGAQYPLPHRVEQVLLCSRELDTLVAAPIQGICHCPAVCNVSVGAGFNGFDVRGEWGLLLLYEYFCRQIFYRTSSINLWQIQQIYGRSQYHLHNHHYTTSLISSFLQLSNIQDTVGYGSNNRC